MCLKFVLVCLVLGQATLNSCQSSKNRPYDFTPESNHIDVNEGDFFHVGFDEKDDQTDFDHCYYISDTITGDYPMVKPSETETSSFAELSTNSGITPNTGGCSFSDYSVDENIPLKWTIIAHDNITKKNFSEDVTITFFYNMPLFLDKVTVLATASFANLFDPGDVHLTTCRLIIDEITIELDLQSIKVYTGDNALKSRVSSLGGGRCGYKVIRATHDDNGEITLIATDDQKKTYRNTAPVVVINQDTQQLKNITMEVYLGSSAIVICGIEHQQYCYLYNPRGELVSHDTMCNYQLDIVTIEDLGIWKCRTGVDYIMDNLDLTTELVEKKPESVQTFTQNTTDFFIIGCKLVNFDYQGLKYCKFTRPDGKMFKVTKGGATEYYNTFTTDLDESICSLEMVKPLRDEDKGSWKCEAVFLDMVASGAFITVVNSKTIPYDKVTKRNVRLGNSFDVDCMVSYSSDYCHIIAPDGSQYEPDNPNAIMAGICSLHVDNATSSDNGTWSCSIARPNGIPDDVIRVEISIIELKVLYADAEAHESEDVELICNTDGIPLKYCRFVSPTGLSYSLRKGATTTNRINYNERGLEFGDCGVKISKIAHDDAGTWSCHVSLGRRDYERKTDLTRKIELTVSSNSSLSTAESVGIAFGVLAVAVITAAFVFYKYSKRMRTARNGDTTAQFAARESNGSGSSGESVVLGVPRGTYNTTS